MTTLVLSKYADKKEEQPKEEDKKVTIDVEGTISSIIANALYKAMPNNVEIKEEQGGDNGVKVVSSESVNTDPAIILDTVSKGDVVLVLTDVIKTENEQWFLSNLEGKEAHAIYTLESLVRYVKKELGV